MLQSSLLALAFIIFSIPAHAGTERSIVGFYNIENMFDSVDDPLTKDEEFTPNGSLRWTLEKSEQKITNISTVIRSMAPDLIGLAEVENAFVIEQLIHKPALANMDYGYVHYDSPDERGIDVALLYKKDSFIVLSSQAIPVDLSQYSNRPTRDILHVEGLLKGEKVHLLVNHWPSRSSGQVLTNRYRAIAATTAKRIVDEINQNDPQAKVILMGDLNDNPVDASLVTYLGAKNFQTALNGNELFNPFYAKFKKGYGSLAYQDVWSSFDQILVSKNLVAAEQGWKFTQDQVFNKSFLVQNSGRYQGYPLRTINDTGTMGFSDHFPVLITLER